MIKNEWILRLKKLADDTTLIRKSTIEKLGPEIIELAAVISGVIGSGKKLLLAGNGGSAADASHFACEMIVRLSPERNRQSLPAVALSSDSSILTAAANDYGFENIFARQVEGLGQKGDMLLVISTSGNSLNLLKAVQVAKKQKVLTTGLLGSDGGRLQKMVDRALVVPHPSTQRVQEEHRFIIHILVELIESDLLNDR
jgi:D-sedoheptulose 7-phosphate isomerase